MHFLIFAHGARVENKYKSVYMPTLAIFTGIL